MSLFGRALAGAGQGASEIASKYIDEGIAEQRAQVLADIQRKSAVQQMQEVDQYTNDPDRRSRMAALAGQDTVAASAATDQATLARNTNQPLMQSSIDATNAVNTGTAQSEAAKVGLVQAAKERATPIKTTPGEIVFNGDGSQLVSNTNMTPAEANLAALREGLKGAKGEARDRAFEQAAKSAGDLIKETTNTINKGIADGTLSTKPPAPGDKPNPAYDNYQYLLQQQRLYAKQQSDITAQWHAEGLTRGGRDGSPTGTGTSARPDPLGINSSPGDSGVRPGMERQPGDTSDTAPVYRSQVQTYLRQLADTSLSPEQRTRLESDMQRVIADAAQQGIKVDLDELKKGVVAPAAGGGESVMDRALRIAQTSDDPKARVAALSAAAPKTAAAAAAAEIPPPPPETGYNGNARAQNPAFVAWSKRYTMADYEAQERRKQAEREAEAAAARAEVERRRSVPAMRGNV